MFDEFEQCDSETRIIAEKVVDLGVTVEDAFKSAISLLFTRDWSSAFTMFPPTLDIAPITLAGKCIALMTRWSLPSDRLRYVMALQHGAIEFDEILTIISRIAERSRHLDDDFEKYLYIIGPNGTQAFYQLLQSAHVQLRGCVMALNLMQSETASYVIAQDNRLDQAYFETQSAIKNALVNDMELTLPLGYISVIVGDIEQIGNHITRICQRVEAAASGGLFTPIASDASIAAIM